MMSVHERFLFRRAKARMRSMRNDSSPFFDQADYEMMTKHVREMIKEGQFTAPILSD